MWINELLYFIILFIDLAFGLFALRFGLKWITSHILINLVIISVFGSKLVEIFGLLSNVGNIFYAVVFFLGHILVEHYGKKEAFKSVWIAGVPILFLLVMTQLILDLEGSEKTAEISKALLTAFANMPLLSMASIFAYFISQNFNVWLYGLMMERSRGKRLWLRGSLSNVLGQAIDSAIFFTLAFSGLFPKIVFQEVMAAGFFMKIGAGLFGTLFLYLSYYFRQEDSI